MKHIILSGTYSVGKSTVAKQLEKDYPDHYHTPDLAREYLNRHDLRSDTMTDKQRKDMQLWVAASYIGNMKQSEVSKKLNISDSSLIEVYAYSENVLSEVHLASIAFNIEKFRKDMFALVFLPTIPLDNDGTRHTNEEFRITIHQRIMDVIRAFNIEYQFIIGSSVEERVKEVCSYIEQ